MTTKTSNNYVNAHSKSITLAIILAILFGPIGAIYGSVIGGIILILITVFTGLIGLLVTWPLGILVAAFGAIQSRRKAKTHAALMTQ